MSLRRLAFLALLSVLSSLFYVQRPREALFTLAPVESFRLKQGRDEEADRQALARAVAGACGMTIPADLDFDPFLVWADFLAEPGQELALAVPVSRTEGLLALLLAKDKGWSVAVKVGPDELGIPTSLATLTLPGLSQTALVLTDLADQLEGAYSRRENCTIYVMDKSWRKVWSKEIESEAYWNLAWDRPPGQGWVRLAGSADWRAQQEDGGLCLSVLFRNTLAWAPAAPDGRLPETGKFAQTKQVNGHEVFRWDPALGLFVLGYARTRHATPMRANRHAEMSPGDPLPADQPLAILADGADEPPALIGQGRLLQVFAAGRIGFVPASSVRRLPSRPSDFPGGCHAWLLPRP